jgi:hypothetical protein
MKNLHLRLNKRINFEIVQEVPIEVLKRVPILVQSETRVPLKRTILLNIDLKIGTLLKKIELQLELEI